jgi:peptidyl-prolyl cis-trans isomerase A (cyclophilin A)
LTALAAIALAGAVLAGASPPAAEVGAGGSPDASAQPPRVRLETDLGPIVLEVYPDRAPVSAANFLRYADEGRFDGASFYRVVTPDNQPDNPVEIEVIQGGLGFADHHPQRLPPIRHETTAEIGFAHRDGTVSMARLEPGTASSEFFICIGDQPELDFGGRRNPDGQGFAAFGRVVEGMEVVRRIQRLPAEGQMLAEPVTIGRAVRAED